MTGTETAPALTTLQTFLNLIRADRGEAYERVLRSALNSRFQRLYCETEPTVVSDLAAITRLGTTFTVTTQNGDGVETNTYTVASVDSAADTITLNQQRNTIRRSENDQLTSTEQQFTERYSVERVLQEYARRDRNMRIRHLRNQHRDVVDIGCGIDSIRV
jgi:hypothetical protein